jgi:hypothetical protein
MRFRVLVLLSMLPLTGCQSKARTLQRLQAEYNAAYPAYATACMDDGSSGAARLLTGQKLTTEQMAALEARKKVREAQCKPLSDHLAQIQREILAAQQ